MSNSNTSNRKNTLLWQQRFLGLIGPLFYYSLGNLFGFILCLTWFQQQPLNNNDLSWKMSFIPQQGVNFNKKFSQDINAHDRREVASSSSEFIYNNEPTSQKLERINKDHSFLSDEQQDFFRIANATKTDKVSGIIGLEKCLKNDTLCSKPSCVNPRCRPWGHFYQTLYQSRLGHLSTNTTEEFQMLEIGFFSGYGFETYSKFFPRAELHSMEISCSGKWPYPNFAALNRKYYRMLRDSNHLHCGDASDANWLAKIYHTHMMARQRKDDDPPPPLKLVIDDGSHFARDMVKTFFFWFPRLEPGGFLVIEDIQPILEANKFRTQFLPQLMSDLHFCGDPKQRNDDEPCFPLLQKLLHSIHCEMHICIFQRNNEPAIPNLPLDASIPPRHALSLNGCKSLRESFGLGL